MVVIRYPNGLRIIEEPYTPEEEQRLYRMNRAVVSAPSLVPRGAPHLPEDPPRKKSRRKRRK